MKNKIFALSLLLANLNLTTMDELRVGPKPQFFPSAREMLFLAIGFDHINKFVSPTTVCPHNCPNLSESTRDEIILAQALDLSLFLTSLVAREYDYKKVELFALIGCVCTKAFRRNLERQRQIKQAAEHLRLQRQAQQAAHRAEVGVLIYQGRPF